MGFWSWITGSGKAVDAAANIATDISSGVDMMFYTDEEKAQAAQKGFDSFLKLMEIEKDAASIRAVTRRLIAAMITLQWGICTNILLYMELFGEGTTEKMVNLYTDVTKVFMIVVSFYFLTYLTGQVKKK